MTKQVDLFGGKPRKKYEHKMHVNDAGGDGDKHLANFTCKRCGAHSDWLEFDTMTEIRRGIACPNCDK